MNYSATDPYFPENLEDYAPWVAKHGLRAPYGKCQCGCDADTLIARRTRGASGLKKGEPLRFIQGHNARIFDDSPPGFKLCSRCRAVKPVASFYTRSDSESAIGVQSRCIQCISEVCRNYHHGNRQDRIQKIREYGRRNRETLAAKERARRSDVVYRKKRGQKLKEWRKRNHEYVNAYNRSPQVKARMAVNKAIQRGELPRPDSLVCEQCQEAQAKEYHHYAGYEKEEWYCVEALCTECHGKKHRMS